MKKLYILSTLSDDDLINEIGEAQFAFDENCNFLDFWAYNDANFRTEYFSPLMEKLGYDVVDQHPNEKELILKAWNR